MDKSINSIDDESWVQRKKILLILAHPDDPDFFCGAKIAQWCEQGHEVHYFILTKGQRGFPDREAERSVVETTRMREQMDAARVLGVASVKFSHFLDGDLIPDLALREEIIREIRKQKPQIIVTSDPLNLFPADNRINHPDHRAAGQAVVDAVFPAAGNPMYDVQDQDGKRLESHQVQELWLSLTSQPNTIFDMTSFFERKLEAVFCHRSQIHGGKEQLREHLRSRCEIDPKTGECHYLEKFKRIILQV